jgi:hypothetical protein
MKKRLNFLGVIDGFFRSLLLICLGGERSLLACSLGAGELMVLP